MNSKIKSIDSNKKNSNENTIASIMKTYAKISIFLSFQDLTEEDIRNIQRFYSYLCLEGAKGMLNENAKCLAYEEMKNYVGNYSYSKEIQSAYLHAYMNLLEYYKVLKLEENTQEELLKLA